MTSSKGEKRQRTPELKVVFDTSAIYSGSESNLLRQDVMDLIKANRQHSDLDVTWYVPEIVRHERQYQMLDRGLALLPSIQKLERLLGHQLNITDSIIKQRVNEAIEEQAKVSCLKFLPLDCSKVDWNRLVLDSVYRRPPFEPGENEKGFRDAVLVESFMQLVEISPQNPSQCRVALVTEDNLLAEAARVHAKQLKNVRIVTLEELKSLINTLIGEVTEDFVAKIQEKAKSYFFEKEQTETLYYKESIRAKITKKFVKELQSIPQGADERENGTWFIQVPRFVKKEKQRLFWANRINVVAKAYKYATKASQPADTPFQAIFRNAFAPFNIASAITVTEPEKQSITTVAPSPFTLRYSVPSPTEEPSSIFSSSRLEKSLVTSGNSIFEVTWSVTVTTRGNFKSPKIECIDYVETQWK